MDRQHSIVDTGDLRRDASVSWVDGAPVIVVTPLEGMAAFFGTPRLFLVWKELRTLSGPWFRLISSAMRGSRVGDMEG
jgi:hypothetical protein